MKKLLFVTALNPDLALDLRQPSLGVGYMASQIQRERPDRYEIRHGNRGVAALLDSWRPDLVLISSTSPYFGLARAYARQAKARGIPTVIGGIHISMLPESMYPEMDVAVLGEGERTLVRLLDLWEETGGFPKDRLRGIAGTAFREADGTLFRSDPAEYIDPLDQLPFPDRSLGFVPRHSHLITSRGCPYHCSFCASTRFWPGKTRFFSAEYVVAEIEELVGRYNVSLISFYDDLFTANLPRLKKVATLLEERKLAGRLKFTCNARANVVTDELAEAMKAMNVVSVNMGLESGNQTTLEFLKDRVTVEQNRRAIDILQRHGFFVSGSFIIGSPRETEAQMMDTYEFLRRSPLAITDVYVLLPYPGTPIWQYALGRGLVSNDMDWSRLTYGSVIKPKHLINLSEHLSSERLCEIHRRFMRLRYRKILSNILFHPYRVDLVRTAMHMAVGATKSAARKVLRAVAGGKRGGNGAGDSAAGGR